MPHAEGVGRCDPIIISVSQDPQDNRIAALSSPADIANWLLDNFDPDVIRITARPRYPDILRGFGLPVLRGRRAGNWMLFDVRGQENPLSQAPLASRGCWQNCLSLSGDRFRRPEGPFGRLFWMVGCSFGH